MERPKTVVAIAVVELAGSALTLGTALLIGLGAMMLKASALAGPQSSAAMVTAAAGMYFACAGWGIASAIGLLQMRVWALVSTLLFSFLLLTAGAVTGISLAILAIPGSTPAAAAVARVFGVGVGLTFAGIALWWIVYLLRSKVRAAFYGARQSKRGQRVPLSIAILAWMCIAGGAGCLLSAPLLGHKAVFALASFVITGTGAQIGYFAFGIIGLALGFGLLALRMWARWAAMVWFVIGTLNAVATWLVPGAWAKMMQAAQMRGIAGTAAPVPVALQSGWFAGIMGVITMTITVVSVYFLWTRRPAFLANARVPANG
ncbi:MAG: hypothetical protein ACRD0Y_05700 [Terriglobales bacterium]